jgi:hypothetical protein
MWLYVKIGGKGMNIILKNLPDTDLCIWDDVFQHRFVKPGTE